MIESFMLSFVYKDTLYTKLEKKYSSRGMRDGSQTEMNDMYNNVRNIK